MSNNMNGTTHIPGATMSKRGSFGSLTQQFQHAHDVSQDEKDQRVIRRQYDPHNHFKNLLAYKGTVIQLLATSPIFWLLNVLNVIVFVSWDQLAEHHKTRVLAQWHLHLNYMQPMGSFVVFLVVFYTSNCFTNYKDLFLFGAKIQHNTALWAVQLKSILRSSGGHLEWQCIRHMISAQRIFYYEQRAKVARQHGYGPQDGTSKHPGEFSVWAKENLIDTSLLRKEEAALLQDFHGSRMLLLTSWSQTSWQEFGATCPRFQKLSPPMQTQYLRHCLDTNISVEQLFESTRDTIHFGVPFVYHHIVHFAVLVYMILLPFANVFVQEGVPSYWTLITYLAVSFVLLGVLEAADAMADPYGEDDCDFNLVAMMDATYREIVQILGADDEAKLPDLFKVAVLPPYLVPTVRAPHNDADTDTPVAESAPQPITLACPSPPSSLDDPPVSLAARAAEGKAEEERAEVLPPESVRIVERLLRVLGEKEREGLGEREKHIKEGSQRTTATHTCTGGIEPRPDLASTVHVDSKAGRRSMSLDVDENGAKGWVEEGERAEGRKGEGEGGKEGGGGGGGGGGFPSVAIRDLKRPDWIERASRPAGGGGGGGGGWREGKSLNGEDVEVAGVGTCRAMQREEGESGG